ALVREEYIFSSADRCTFVLDSHLQQRMNLDEVIEKETARFASSASPPSVRGHLTLCRFSSIIIPSRKVAFERRGIQSSPPSPSGDVLLQEQAGIPTHACLHRSWGISANQGSASVAEKSVSHQAPGFLDLPVGRR